MLGDAAGLAAGDVGLAQRVEKRGLAVVDMTHDGYDGRARLKHLRLVGVAAQPDLNIGFGDPVRPMAEFGDDQLGRVRIQDLVHRRHDAHAHQ